MFHSSFLFILKTEEITRTNNPLCYPSALMERQRLREYKPLNSYDLTLKYPRFDTLFREFARWTTRALVITVTIFKDVRNLSLSFSLPLSISIYLFVELSSSNNRYRLLVPAAKSIFNKYCELCKRAKILAWL